MAVSDLETWVMVNKQYLNQTYVCAKQKVCILHPSNIIKCSSTYRYIGGYKRICCCKITENVLQVLNKFLATEY